MRGWQLAAVAGSGFFMLAAGCTLMRQAAPLPAGGDVVRDQLMIHSDFQLPRRHRLVDELVAQRGDVVERLRLPVSDEPIHIYLFESSKRFDAFMANSFPDFPDRRAFFVETDTRLNIYAYWGDRVAEDLRHEVAHGYLHTMVPYLPLWLDEGLAEYFEVPRGQRGLNRPHVTLLLEELSQSRWWPNMEALENLQSAADMTQRDYAESWAWMYLMLESSPERRELLQSHLARLRMAGNAPPLSELLQNVESRISHSLVDHLRSLSDQ